MDNHRLTDTDVELALHNCRDRLDIPAMADAVPTVLSRIQTPQRATVAATTASPPVSVEDQPSPARSSSRQESASDRMRETSRSRSRELLGIAGAALAIALIGGILVFLFQNQNDSSEDATPGANILPTPAPYQIDGYDFVQAIGGPSVPNQPADTVVGEDGTVYVADVGLNRVLAFNDDGELDTSWSDDGMSEKLEGPLRLALDSENNLYVVEFDGNSIQKFGPSGAPVTSWDLTDEAGGTTSDGSELTTQPTGIVADSNGNVYVAERYTKLIEKFDSSGQLLDTWDLTAGRDSSGITSDIAIDEQDRIYVPSRIPGEGVRVLNTNGETIAEWDTGASSLAIRNGTVYALVQTNPEDDTAYKIRRSDLDGNLISEHPVDVADVTPIGTPIDRPISPGVDSDGNVYLGDPARQRIVAFGPDGDIVREIPGEGNQFDFGGVAGVEVDDDANVYGTDPLAGHVLKFDPEGEYLASFDVQRVRSGSRAPTLKGANVAVAEDGTAYVVNTESDHITVFSPNGGKVDEWDLVSGEPSDQAQPTPVAIALDGQGHLFILEQEGGTIQKFTTDGEFLSEWPYQQDTDSIEGFPLDLTVADGTVYVLGYGAIRTFDLEGNLLDVVTQFKIRFENPPDEALSVMRFAVDAEGNSYVTAMRFGRDQEAADIVMQKFSPSGALLQTRQLWQLEHLRQIDIAVQHDKLYLTDPANKRILVYEPAEDESSAPTQQPEPTQQSEQPTAPPEPTATTPAPTRQSPIPSMPFELEGYEFAGAFGGSTVPNIPTDVVIAPDGTTFVADAGLSRVLAFNQDGGLVEGWGPDGLGISAITEEPTGLALDDSGTLYVLEFISGRIRTIDAETGQFIGSWSVGDSSAGSGLRAQGLALDGQGNIYVTGRGVNQHSPGDGVKVFGPDGELIRSWELGEVQSSDIAIDSQDRVYVMTESELRVFNTDGESIAEWPRQQYAGQIAAENIIGSTLTIDDDNVYVVNYSGNPAASQTGVVKLNADGDVLAEWTADLLFVQHGSAGRFPGSPGIDGGDNLYIPNPEQQQVLKLSPDGQVVGEIGFDTTGRFANLGSIDVDDDGNLYAVDTTREQIVAFGPDGQFTTEFSMQNDGAPFTTIQDVPDIATGPDGSIFLTNPKISSISHFAPDGTLIGEWGELDFDSEDQPQFPMAIEVDADGRVYILDQSWSVKTFTAEGEYMGKLSESLHTFQNETAGFAVADGSAYVTTSGGNGSALERFDLEGNQTGTIIHFGGARDAEGTVAGYPMSIAADDAGNVYIPLMLPPGEQGTKTNRRLVKVGPDGEILVNVDIGPRNGLTYTAVGPDGTLYITDPLTEHVLIYEPGRQ